MTNQFSIIIKIAIFMLAFQSGSDRKTNTCL